MTQQYDDTNRGAMFKNTRRETDRHPEYKGTLDVNGTAYWISAWLKVSAQGEKYMSLSVQPKDAAPAKPAPATRKQSSVGMDDDIPF